MSYLRNISLVAPTALLLCFLSAPAVAESDESEAAHRQAAIADIEATAQLLSDTHPGLLPAARDPNLRQRWRKGLEKARNRARQVSSEGGRRAVLDGLANVFQDPHITLRHQGESPAWVWPGFTVNLAQDGFKVAFANPDTGIQTGAMLVSCDGRSASALARDRLVGFRAYETDPASLVSATPWLFVEDGNPFLSGRPRRCTFRTASKERVVDLNWSAVTYQQMLPGLVASAMYQGQPSAGASMRDGMIWISVPDQGPDAQTAIDAATPLVAAATQQTPILLDLRTNTGGNSLYGDRLISLIYGADAIGIAQQTAGLQATEKFWRASEPTITMAEDRARSLEGDDPELIAQRTYWTELASELRTAKGKDAPFNRPLPSGSRARSADRATKKPAEVPSSRPVYFFTDNFCSSSCLLLVSQLRALGAVQLGSATTVSRRYTEAVSIALPSGRSRLTSLVSVSTGGLQQIGPFQPDRQLPGTVRTSQAIENWIVAEIKRSVG
jgi:hypothetical protein